MKTALIHSHPPYPPRSITPLLLSHDARASRASQITGAVILTDGLLTVPDRSFHQ